MDAGGWSSFIFQPAPPPAVAPPPDALPPSELLPPLLPDPSPATAAASTVDPGALKPAPPLPEAPVPPPEVPLSQAPEATPPTRKSKSKGPYVCAQCAKEFKNGYNLRRHQATHGARPPALMGALSQGSNAAASAAVSLLPDGSTASSPPILMGALSDGTTGSGAGSARKRKSHACEACGKAFRDVYHLRRHRLAHSDERPFQCPVCQQRFKRKDRMGHHLRGHQGAVHRPYACAHCPKAFSRPDHLNSHVRQVHSTERPFKCQTCEAAFATKDRLRAHAVRHEDKVPCHVCGKLLSAAYIGDHMKVHGHGPTHVCGLCNKGFTTAAYLRVHAAKDHGSTQPHGARSLRCRLCGVHCATAAQLRGHLQTHGPTHDASGPAHGASGPVHDASGPAAAASGPPHCEGGGAAELG